MALLVSARDIPDVRVKGTTAAVWVTAVFELCPPWLTAKVLHAFEIEHAKPLWLMATLLTDLHFVL